MQRLQGVPTYTGSLPLIGWIGQCHLFGQFLQQAPIANRITYFDHYT